MDKSDIIARFNLMYEGMVLHLEELKWLLSQPEFPLELKNIAECHAVPFISIALNEDNSYFSQLDGNLYHVLCDLKHRQETAIKLNVCPRVVDIALRPVAVADGSKLDE